MLVYGPYGPPELILSEGSVQLQGITTPLRQVNTVPRTLQVKAAHHYIVTNMAEMALDAYVDAPTHQALKSCSQLVVEPLPSLAHNYSLAMAPSLVDAASNCTVKVRVMNPTHSAVSLSQDTVLGIADTALAIEHQVAARQWPGSCGEVPMLVPFISPTYLQPASVVVVQHPPCILHVLLLGTRGKVA